MIQAVADEYITLSVQQLNEAMKEMKKVLTEAIKLCKDRIDWEIIDEYLNEETKGNNTYHRTVHLKYGTWRTARWFGNLETRPGAKEQLEAWKELKKETLMNREILKVLRHFSFYLERQFKIFVGRLKKISTNNSNNFDDFELEERKNET